MYNHAYALIGLGMVHNLCGLMLNVAIYRVDVSLVKQLCFAG